MHKKYLITNGIIVTVFALLTILTARGGQIGLLTAGLGVTVLLAVLFLSFIATVSVKTSGLF